MKTKLFDGKGKEKGTIELPKNFNTKIRKDILSKVFEAEKIKRPTGAKMGAGAQYSASGILRHRRSVWKTTYGKGISRVPRKIMSRSGASFNWIGATVASTRGGRRAHPPKAKENQFKKINKKEFLIAINSALSGTIDNKSLSEKYKKDIKDSCFVFDSEFLKSKSKEFFSIIRNIFGEELKDNLLQKKNVRPGKGKSRGRKYKKNAGLLFVVGSEEKMNRKGIDVVKVSDLLLSDLAPNGKPGRLTCYTEKAIKEIGEELK